MFTQEELPKVLFIDIETVSQQSSYEELSPAMQKAWLHEANKIIPSLDAPFLPEELFMQNAALHAEFGKVVCISFGCIHYKDGQQRLRVKSICGDDEVALLKEFKELINNPKIEFLCAHNGKGFDYPFLCKRYIINQIALPNKLCMNRKKPWELAHLTDSMDFWKFCGWNGSKSLDLLCSVFGLPTSKDDINGFAVTEVYWQEKNLQRIVTYCEKDVVALTQLALRLSCLPLVERDNIQVVKEVPPPGKAPMKVTR